MLVDSNTMPALGSARAMIERHLSTAFGQLDAETGDIELRKQLHAAFVHEAIVTASARFPHNYALADAIDSALALIDDR